MRETRAKRDGRTIKGREMSGTAEEINDTFLDNKKVGRHDSRKIIFRAVFLRERKKKQVEAMCEQTVQ